MTAAFAALERAAADFSGLETAVPVDLATFKLAENLGELDEGELGILRAPLPPRGPATGLVLVDGVERARWGDPGRPDVAFSVSKASFSVLAGLALADGRIGSLDDRVAETVPLDLFDAPHNRPITWRHLLTLTSEWSGTLWGLPDRIDWHRTVPKNPAGPKKGSPRTLAAPGTHWEFNDVRVNVLSLSLTRLFGESLETVFRDRVLAPLGGGRGFVWRGFDGITTDIDGRAVPVVVGGGHWGGGQVVSAEDLALFAELHRRRGRIGEVRILPETWFDAIREATPAHPSFGLAWWVNRAGALPFLSREAVWASGIANFVVTDPERGLTVVIRWFDIPRRDEILSRIAAIVDEGRA